VSLSRYVQRNVSADGGGRSGRTIGRLSGDSASIGFVMADYVELTLRRNRGWPWPEESWGLTPMYGADGWCHSCGVPKHEQVGSLVLQGKGMAKAEGAWVPNWLFDAYCLDARTADAAVERFSLELLPVLWHGRRPDGDAMQIVARSSAQSWFEPEWLSKLTSSVHGVAGATCPDCRVWRWMPVGMEDLQLPPANVFKGDPAVVASPEWFGDGAQAFRQILWRRDLAQLLLKVSPRDFKLQEVANRPSDGRPGKPR